MFQQILRWDGKKLSMNGRLIWSTDGKVIEVIGIAYGKRSWFVVRRSVHVLRSTFYVPRSGLVIRRMA